MAFVRGVLPCRSQAWMLAAGLGLACGGAPAEPMNSTSGDPVEVPPWPCVPGETQPCPCTEGLEGLLTCAPDGSGFGACDCSPGAVSQGPPPTSGDTETGTGTGTAGSGSGDATVGSTTGPTTNGSTTAPDPTTTGASTGPAGTTSGSSTSV